MKIYRLLPGTYEILDNGKMKYRIYRNRWGTWTLAIFSELHQQFIDSRYFPTLKQAKESIM